LTGVRFVELDPVSCGIGEWLGNVGKTWSQPYTFSRVGNLTS